MKRACRECEFYYGRESQCRLNPPVRLPRRFTKDATPESRERDERIIWSWPWVYIDSWCGQFKLELGKK